MSSFFLTLHLTLLGCVHFVFGGLYCLSSGKWSAPLIDNEAYQGPWAPRKIENPNYFVDNTPAEGLTASIGSAAIEVRTY